MNLIIPENYDPVLSLRQTQEAIKYIRDTFQKEFGSWLNHIFYGNRPLSVCRECLRIWDGGILYIRHGGIVCLLSFRRVRLQVWGIPSLPDGRRVLVTDVCVRSMDRR